MSELQVTQLSNIYKDECLDIILLVEICGLSISSVDCGSISLQNCAIGKWFHLSKYHKTNLLKFDVILAIFCFMRAFRVSSY